MNTRRDFLTNAALASAAAVAAIAGVQQFASAQSSAFGRVARFSGADRKAYPDVILRDQDNQPLRFYEEIIRDRVVVINMAYAECLGICPLAARNLKKLHRAMRDRVGRDFHMYTLTLDPLRDRPEKLKYYMRREGIPDQGWQFLTGTVGDIQLVRRRLGFFDVDPLIDADVQQHTGMVAIGNDRYDWWCSTPALASEQTLVTAVERMLKYG